jgi:aldose 1-epimerase
LNHQVWIRGQKFVPVNSSLIPTGELRPVAGTPFDFRKATAIGARIDQDNEQLKFGMGYDQTWVLEANKKPGPRLAAEAFEPASGRVLEVLTTQPGVQFYTGNSLDGAARGKGGQVYARRTAFCLETQHFPDSPNQPNFPSTELKPGETFQSTTILRFSTRK